MVESDRLTDIRERLTSADWDDSCVASLRVRADIEWLIAEVDRLKELHEGLYGSHAADTREVHLLSRMLQHVAWAWRSGILRVEISPDGEDMRAWLEALQPGPPLEDWHRLAQDARCQKARGRRTCSSDP